MGVYKEGNGDGMPGAFPFKAVIFDMDGVLVDTEVYYLDCRGQFLAESGVEVSHEELLELVGASVKQDRANMLKWFTRSGISIDAEGIEKRKLAGKAKSVEAAKEAGVNFDETKGGDK